MTTRERAPTVRDWRHWNADWTEDDWRRWHANMDSLLTSTASQPLPAISETTRMLAKPIGFLK